MYETHSHPTTDTIPQIGRRELARRESDGVAVARYVRTGEGVAEPAISVVDDWQGRGLATVLLDELVGRAREEGIRSFAAPVLAAGRAVVAGGGLGAGAAGGGAAAAPVSSR